jgi:transcriptional regulator with XRE-family HTH domain
MKFKDRLKAARVAKGFSQAELANKIEIHVTNISRYERGENKPTTEVLSKMADALDVTSDYLMSGSIDDKANIAISDKELLSQFKKVEALPNDKRTIFKEVIDALLIKTELQLKFSTK